MFKFHCAADKRYPLGLMRLLTTLFVFLLQASVSVAAPAILPVSVDISVSGISLHDRTSQEQVLGADIPFDKDADIPMAIFPSADGRQYLTVFTHPGGVGEISEFQVSSSVTKKPLAHRLKKVERFISGKGIYLGLTKSHVTAILGAPLRQREEGDIVTLDYRLDETDLNRPGFHGGSLV